MRAIVALVGLGGFAHASPQPWSVDVTYRGTASITTAGDDVPSAYASSLVTRIEHATGRWFVGAVIAIGVPRVMSQAESSISGGFHHVLRDGVCVRGPTTQLHCGPTLRLDYALDFGVTMVMPQIWGAGGADFLYYGPAVRPRVSYHASWPTRSGKEIGFAATLGLAAVYGTNMAMETVDRRSAFRLEPSLELGGTIRF
ncbi:MAG: hypothetical protein ACKV2T_39000 [Kofleriaceae bacterium]